MGKHLIVLHHFSMLACAGGVLSAQHLSTVLCHFLHVVQYLGLNFPHFYGSFHFLQDAALRLLGASLYLSSSIYITTLYQLMLLEHSYNQATYQKITITKKPSKHLIMIYFIGTLTASYFCTNRLSSSASHPTVSFDFGKALLNILEQERHEVLFFLGGVRFCGVFSVKRTFLSWLKFT